MHDALNRFFDPKDGRVTERLQAFLSDDGTLAGLLRRFVGTERSVLSETLARQVGESSPLFKLLDPNESEGLVGLLEDRIERALERSRGELGRALDPLHEEGAVGRFLKELKREIAKADDDRHGQLVLALAALNQNDENSLISTMRRESQAAHEALRRAVNPQVPGSPIATVCRTLEDTLQGRLASHEERLESLQREQQRFQADVQASVARIETRRHEQAKSVRRGAPFEDAVVEFVARSVPAGLCTVEATGSRPGLRSACKVGDVVVGFSQESAFAGCHLVIEAKCDKTYSSTKALDELEVAMANRGAQAALFVMARATAPAGFPPFARFGNRILVVWDPEDAVSDGLLHGAIVCALALAQRRKAVVDRGDIAALADVEHRLGHEIRRLEVIAKSAESIRKQAEKISDEVRKGRKKLATAVEKAKETLLALDVELRDEEAETGSPIIADALAPEVAVAEVEAAE